MVGGCSPPSPPPYMGGEKPPCSLHVGLCAPPLAPRSCVFPPSSHPVMQKANASGVVIYVQNLFKAFQVLNLLLKSFDSPKSPSSEGLKGVAGVSLWHYLTMAPRGCVGHLAGLEPRLIRNSPPPHLGCVVI